MARKVSVRDRREYRLTGSRVVRGDLQRYEQLFVHEEKETALAIARLWYERGWRPTLTSKVYDGSEFKTWFDWRKEDAKAAKVRPARKPAA